MEKQKDNLEDVKKNILPVCVWANIILSIISITLSFFNIDTNFRIIFLIINIILLGTYYIINKYGYIWNMISQTNKISSKLNDFLVQNG